MITVGWLGSLELTYEMAWVVKRVPARVPAWAARMSARTVVVLNSTMSWSIQSRWVCPASHHPIARPPRLEAGRALPR